MTGSCLGEYTQTQTRYARHRAIILQAIYAQPGMTYTEIRFWIQGHKHFTMEEIGRRVRELARDLSPHLARIEYDGNGRVHVYPLDGDGK